jgi:hypothetical protein
VKIVVLFGIGKWRDIRHPAQPTLTAFIWDSHLFTLLRCICPTQFHDERGVKEKMVDGST